jgi:hypothetical protein
MSYFVSLIRLKRVAFFLTLKYNGQIYLKICLKKSNFIGSGYVNVSPMTKISFIKFLKNLKIIYKITKN